VSLSTLFQTKSVLQEKGFTVTFRITVHNSHRLVSTNFRNLTAFRISATYSLITLLTLWQTACSNLVVGMSSSNAYRTRTGTQVSMLTKRCCILDVNITQRVTPFKISLRALQTVFESAFSEGDLAVEASAVQASDQTTSPRRHIMVDDDFDVVHNILYYLYTDSVAFDTNLDPSRASHLPRICDAEDIYALAHRLDLADLQSKALHFLKLTCTPRNISERVLSPFATVYDQVGVVYDEYFRENWQIVRKTVEFKKCFRDVADGKDFDEISRVFKKFCELFEEAIFTH